MQNLCRIAACAESASLKLADYAADSDATFWKPEELPWCGPFRTGPRFGEPRPVRPHEKEVAKRSGWILVRGLDRGPVELPPWRTFRLYRTVPGRKVVYMFAYGIVEDRMAKVHDWGVLEEHEHEVAEWVLDKIRDWMLFGE